ncbi:hypothetical protein ACLOJK_013560 [Asimina triloba]
MTHSSKGIEGKCLQWFKTKAKFFEFYRTRSFPPPMGQIRGIREEEGKRLLHQKEQQKKKRRLVKVAHNEKEAVKDAWVFQEVMTKLLRTLEEEEICRHFELPAEQVLNLYLLGAGGAKAMVIKDSPHKAGKAVT